MKIKNKSKENKKELNRLQKELNLKNITVFISPEVNSSVDQCIEGMLKLIKGTFLKENDVEMIQEIRSDIEEEIKEVMGIDAF